MYRARANGNLLETVPESLIGVLYDPVEEEVREELPDSADALQAAIDAVPAEETPVLEAAPAVQVESEPEVEKPPRRRRAR